MTRIAVTAAAMVLLTAGANAQAGMTAIERQRLLAHLDMTRAWLVDEVSGLSDAQLTFKPSPDAWSIAQVLDHLVMVGPIYWNDLQQALATPPGDVVVRDTDADILWYGIDRTHREQAIATEIPQGKARDLTTLLRDHRRHHDRLRNYVRTTRDDLRRHLVPRQGSDAYQWVLLISTHEQRHILQIRDIKIAPGFPD
jgi:uncharacterized damage-inducible protein DinB